MLSPPALRAIATEHQLVGVVRAAPATGAAPPRLTPRRLFGAAARALGLRRPGSLADLARSQKAPLWEARTGDDPEISAQVRAVQPDVICIAGYPWLLRGDIISTPPALTLNVHAALLPRHRGPLPLFWIYHADDRETGVTVHAVTAAADAGAVLGQESYPLPRGYPVEELNRLNADRGAELLLRVLGDIAVGRTTPVAQDDTIATRAPYVKAGQRMVDFEHWDVERVWHFCAGLFPRFVEPLTMAHGAAIRYGGVAGYERRGTTASPGSVTPSAEGWELHCRGGIVRLTR
ncbi:MAG: formyltransferase family protein [Gemmatimonadota bacterium]|nr:formyltransferase family protein [Gemmatimonadota bacterium]